VGRPCGAACEHRYAMRRLDRGSGRPVRGMPRVGVRPAPFGWAGRRCPLLELGTGDAFPDGKADAVASGPNVLPGTAAGKEIWNFTHKSRQQGMIRAHLRPDLR